MGKLPSLHPVQITRQLRPDELQFVAMMLDHVRARLGADADPIDARMDRNSAVAFNGDLKPVRVQSVDNRIIDLLHGFAARDHNIARLRAVTPQSRNFGSKVSRVITPAIFTIHADKISIAKLADGRTAVFFATRPQIASGKAQKHRTAARMDALALKRQENLFNRVAHA